MKAKKLWFVMGVLVLLGGSGALWAAAPPGLINYQGVLRDASGAPEDGAFSMVFRFYNTDGGAPACPAVGGTLLLTDIELGVPVTGGLFNVQLGGGSIIPGAEGSLAEVFRDNAAVYLAVTVAGEVLCPRVQVISAAYSLNADHLDGKDATEFLDTSATTQTKGGGLNMLGNVGIGTTGPGEKLTVAGTIQSTSGGFKFPDGTTQTTAGGGGGGGTVISVGTGAGLTGGPITTSGTISIATGGVTNPMLSNDSLTITAGTGLVGGGTVELGAATQLEVGVIGTSNGGTGLTTAPAAAGQFLRSSGVGVWSIDSIQSSDVTASDPPCFDNANRFVDCGNGTVTDTVTGLIWLKDASCATLPGLGGFEDGNYQAANEAAASLQDGDCGLTDHSSPGDWRLQTRAEWQVIVDQAAANGCFVPGPFVPDVVGSGCCGTGTCAFAGVQSDLYWSSVTNASNPGVAWFADLVSGDVIGSSKIALSFVWPVRGGP